MASLLRRKCWGGGVAVSFADVCGTVLDSDSIAAEGDKRRRFAYSPYACGAFSSALGEQVYARSVADDDMFSFAGSAELVSAGMVEKGELRRLVSCLRTAATMDPDGAVAEVAMQMVVFVSAGARR